MTLKGSRLQVEEVIEHKIKIARELELEVEAEDILGSLQCHDKILTDEEMFLQLVQFSHSVVSNSLWPYGLKHPRPLCPSPIPGVYSNSCPLSQWCHPTILSSVIPFSSCPSIKVFSNKSDLLIRWPKYWSFWMKKEGSFLGWNLLLVKILWRLLKW